MALDLRRLQPKRRWLCCECEAEGSGAVPDACPFCGSTDNWFATPDYGSTESLRDRWHRVWDGLLGSSWTIH